MSTFLECPFTYIMSKTLKTSIKNTKYFSFTYRSFLYINIISLNYELHNKQNTAESYLGGVCSFLLNELVLKKSIVVLIKIYTLFQAFFIVCAAFAFFNISSFVKPNA